MGMARRKRLTPFCRRAELARMAVIFEVLPGPAFDARLKHSGGSAEDIDSYCGV